MVHHGRGLRRLLKDDALFAAIEADWRTAPVSTPRAAMLEWAIKLTHTPGDMTADDATRLTQVGFSDRDILDIAEVVGYYAYVNRIADGLGVQTESWIPDDLD